MITELFVPGAPDLEDAYRDDLTKIANRRFFERRLNECLAAPSETDATTILLMLDLDRFKAVNDSLGHAVGDSLLCRVTQRVASQLSDTDTFARLGGDEFGIILHDRCDVSDLATRIIELVQRTYLIDGLPVNVGVSVGVAVFPTDAKDPSHLMRCADLALYQAKSAGRNCFVYFEQAMEVKARDKREMEIELRKAVAMRQLEVHYRPQIDIKSQKLFGLETVLLWKHPQRGVLDAASFIPLAEETGVIIAVGEWALKAVCREASRWPEEVVVALRVSPLQFESNRFFDAVKQSLATYGIKGHRLELEVTEGILLRDGKIVQTMLERLRSIGIRVAIDSFGTGIASLSQMVDFPLDKIKIAKSLVEEGTTGIKERAIVRAIAALGASLGISTVVDGVTTPEHLSRIQMDGCSSIQGCLFSEAVSADMLKTRVSQLTMPMQSTTTSETHS
ncbi:diguanylate cyclase (GGDEF)-like protein [Granulicella aggregans]|uniref:Diguanylate cyclase (GGDEF)-like protein n=1 Tax=Granulicella aggregans TaxID=474949 RepID=A0A7W8E6T9_9BACT|nr:EAL domain-containing protein [Granulicella aggregans]MBB5060694.1 diguanylate cyclase (GGDEF)-like protein [Granulicella aggregans]